DAQASPAGSYRPPVSVVDGSPPHTIMRSPVQTAVCLSRPEGAFVAVIGAHVSAEGSYRPPVFGYAPEPALPPHTTTALPLQTEVAEYRATGAFRLDVGAHESVAGSYRPPVSRMKVLPSGGGM